jgi:hypothetical protein
VPDMLKHVVHCQGPTKERSLELTVRRRSPGTTSVRIAAASVLNLGSVVPYATVSVVPKPCSQHKPLPGYSHRMLQGV